MNRLVSIIIPVYKVPEKYLRQCLDSCVNQTLRDIEIIVVDDGSPDNCPKICDEYAEKDSRVKVIHKKNGGLAAARNTGFDIAKGEFFMFLDGDDYLDPKACEISYAAIIKNNAQVVLWDVIQEFGRSSNHVHIFGDSPILFDKQICKELSVRLLDFNGHIGQVFARLINTHFCRKRNIRHIDNLSQGAEGFVFNIQLFENAERVCYIPEGLLHYTYNNQSISHSFNDKNNYLIVRCFEWINEYIKNSSQHVELQRMLYNRMLYVIVTTAITGYFSPTNKVCYTERVKGFERFVTEPLVEESMRKYETKGLSKQRRFVLWLVRYKMYRLLIALGYIRRWQLIHK